MPFDGLSPREMASSTSIDVAALQYVDWYRQSGFSLRKVNRLDHGPSRMKEVRTFNGLYALERGLAAGQRCEMKGIQSSV
jgi:hypothetical protein